MSSATAVRQPVERARLLYERRSAYWRRLSSLLGVRRPLRQPLDLVRALDEGFTVAALDSLVRRGYLAAAEVSVVAPPRTLSHRRAKRQRLRADESERLARVGKTLVLAEQVFGDRSRALRWLHAPKRRFEGMTPFELLTTAEGGQLVEELLLAIDEGYFA